MAIGYGLAMMLDPAGFVDEPPFRRYSIRSPTQAVLYGALVLVVTAALLRLTHRKARAYPPAVELTPNGLTILVGDSPIDSLPWRDVEAAEVKWEDRVRHLTVSTSVGEIKVAQSLTSVDLDKVSRAINTYRNAHAPL